MTDAEFAALVARLDQQARRSPAAYRLKVILLAYAGYAYVAFVLAGAGILFIAALATLPYLKAFAVKLALVFGAFFWVVASAMWVRLERPQGHRVTRQDAPQLFDLIDRLQRSLRATRFHDVLITEDFNAAVAQTPRLGLLGWYRNALLIGLPLMKALTREQLAAVLAHEFGHLAGGHGRLGNWVYRLRSGWARLAQALQERRSTASFAFRPFFRWYAPYFSAVSFPLARANEYEADAASARLTSPAAAAAALTSVNVVGSFLQARFWPDLHRKADEVAAPSFAPYAQMGDVFRNGIDEAALRGWLDAAMAQETSVADTHPALAERLRALGMPPLLELPQAGEAADTLLGSALPSITAEFDRRWREAIQPSWERRHQEVRAKRDQLAALDERIAKGESLTIDERLQRARLTDDVGAGAEASLAQFRVLYADVPDEASVCFGLGAHLLRIGDDAGVGLIEHAIARDVDALLPGAALLRDYHAACGRRDEAQSWHECWVQRLQVLQAAQAERSGVLQSDRFDPHGLDAAQIDALRAQLSGIAAIGNAYLLRKRVQYFPNQPFLVLAFTIKPWWRRNRAKDAAMVQSMIAKSISFPHEALIVWLRSENFRFLKGWIRPGMEVL